METPGKRKFLGGQDGANKAAKVGGSSGGKMSFAQKMMAKMGYVEGQGLGKEGEGMVNPIEVKLRPQGVGVGAVKEKTQQYKDEQRRAAERRGEEYEDSSDEERKARRGRKMQAQGTVSTDQSGANTPQRAKKQKTKYRTVADVQAAAPGLDVPPQMLSSILDATGSETKLLTSAAGLMQSGGLLVESEAEKIAKRERLELEAYIEAWHGIQEQKVLIVEQEGQHAIELEQRDGDVAKLRSLVDTIEKLKQAIAYTSAVQEDISKRWSTLIEELSSLQEEHRHDLEKHDVAEAAIGALTPVFKKQISEWTPFEDPDLMTADLERVKTAIGFGAQTDVAVVHSLDALHIDTHTTRQRKATSPYETLMYTIWIPKVRTAITNWDVLDYVPLTKLIQSWRPLLPDFIYSNLIDRLIVPKLIDGLETWDPRKRAHRHRHVKLKYADPHTWLYPWLLYLPSYQLDPNYPSSLASELKRRLKQILDGWDVTNGLLPGLTELREFLPHDLTSILIRHLLPKLARHLSTNLEIDPSDQNLDPLTTILLWQPHFSPTVLTRLLLAEFFPKWHTTLHIWLTTPEADISEIRTWTTWWQSHLPHSFSTHPDILPEWSRAEATIATALSLRAQNLPLTSLPPPPIGPARPVAKELDKQASAARRAAQEEAARLRETAEQQTSFRDVVEAWCAEEGLLFLPLREAEAGSGAPLFRITASAAGRGGVVVYFDGDVLRGRMKGGGGGEVRWEPLGLGEELVQRAEGR